MTPDVLRKFVAAVDNVNKGYSPRLQVDFFTPTGKLVAVRRGGRLVIDPASYNRYNLPAEVFASLNTQACAKLYLRLQPLLQQAYRDLGYPEGDFAAALAKAANLLLRTPVVTTDLEARPSGPFYALADAQLEKLSLAQRHFLRMGPANVQKIQAKIRELAAAAGIALEE